MIDIYVEYYMRTHIYICFVYVQLIFVQLYYIYAAMYIYNILLYICTVYMIDFQSWLNPILYCSSFGLLQ